MTAKEMFEKLGYTKQSSFIASIIYKNENTKSIITFNTKKKFVHKGSLDEEHDHFYTNITLDELKAINKQIEELWW